MTHPQEHYTGRRRAGAARGSDQAQAPGTPPDTAAGGRPDETAARGRPDDTPAPGTDHAATGQRPISSPAKLDRQGWLSVLKRAAREYRQDNVSDWAAALTYRAILALFPALVVLVSAVGLLGRSTSDKVLNNVQKHAPDSVQGTLRTIFDNAQSQHSAAGAIGIVSLLVALWSASSYVAAFMRASNNIYDIAEGRPIWKTAPLRIALTIFLVVAVIVAAAIAILSGQIARDVGDAVGLGDTAVTIWSIAKWPLLLIVASLTLAVLYWAAPNARQPGFSWISPGGLLSVVVWALASAGFAVYVANFSSYNKTYGSLVGIIVFLIWLWITNIALLLGAEFNAEMQRARAISAGLPEDEEPYVYVRDIRKLTPDEREIVESATQRLHSTVGTRPRRFQAMVRRLLRRPSAT